MADGPAVEILGVRHHGPGSARSVARALDLIEPATVVIEGPPELDRVAHLAAHAAMRPPVAGLVYDVREPRRASFYPMAVFSPEWVALRWALDHGAEVRFADLPAAQRLAPVEDTIEEVAEEVAETGGASAEDRDSSGENLPVSPDPTGVVADPIGALAAAAGYEDAERWWEDAIEQRAEGGEVLARFAAVREAMAEFRDDPDGAWPPEEELTFRREASMRKILRAVVKATEGPVAVVCGAFHAPVLIRDEWPSVSSDNALLKGLPRTKVEATWAPWTSGRLAYASGYGAGVSAPGWYEHLFAVPEDTISNWMVRVGRALRAQGYDASAASAVEATRLAETLAALRGRPQAGLAEVNDAAQTVLAHGSPLPMLAVNPSLLTGHHLGAVPEQTPMVPLAQDLARQQKSLRLKPSAEQKVVVLDLRKEAQLARSVLFRRLSLLGVRWAVEAETGRTGGTFKEAWQIEWQPELAVAVIEASLHGTTVESAAEAKVRADAEQAADLATLAALVEACLLADLPEALTSALDVLSSRTAVQHDHLALMRAVEPLARTRRYGDVRGVDTESVRQVFATMVTRAAIGLAAACSSLDDDAAAEMRAAIESVERGVALVADGELIESWRDALFALSTTTIHGAVAGRVGRILLDGGRIEVAEAGRRLHRALSQASDPHQAAGWLDGFLAGDVALLLHDPHVFGLVDAWLTELDRDVFDDLLPLVRRTFARFQKGERRQIGHLVSRGAGSGAVDHQDVDLDESRAAGAVEKVAALLGLVAPGEAS